MKKIRKIKVPKEYIAMEKHLKKYWGTQCKDFDKNCSRCLVWKKYKIFRKECAWGWDEE